MSLGHTHSRLSWLDPFIMLEKIGYWDDLFLRNPHRFKGTDVFHMSFPTTFYLELFLLGMMSYWLSGARWYCTSQTYSDVSPTGEGLYWGNPFIKFPLVFQILTLEQWQSYEIVQILLQTIRVRRNLSRQLYQFHFNPYTSYICIAPICQCNKQTFKSFI